MIRYSTVDNKNQREIVLLKGSPCRWGRCTFCDYIHDNSCDESENVKFNNEVLKNVTGKYGSLEVINSGSVFELPAETIETIRKIVMEKNISKLFFECHYTYRNRLQEIENLFDIPIIFKCGIETFDDEFRNGFLKKGAIFKSPEEVAGYFKSVCLMVGIKGQTREMIKRDMDILLKHFQYGCINIYVENTTPLKRDEEIIGWFKENYSHLEDMDNIEILWNNTDFGVGGNDNEIEC